jgi:hypothetical protein
MESTTYHPRRGPVVGIPKSGPTGMLRKDFGLHFDQGIKICLLLNLLQPTELFLGLEN